MCSFGHDSLELTGKFYDQPLTSLLDLETVPFLSPPTKKKKTVFTERQSLDVENIKKNFKAELKEFPLDAFDACFVQFLGKMVQYKCAAVKGEYFFTCTSSCNINPGTFCPLNSLFKGMRISLGLKARYI